MKQNELDKKPSSLEEVAKDIMFKDLQVVDYTFSDGTDYDPDGLLSYMAKKRKGALGGDPVTP